MHRLSPKLSSAIMRVVKERLLKTAAVSVEWRIIAFIVTELFFWYTTGELWQATLYAIALQLILFLVHFGWYFLRETHNP